MSRIYRKRKRRTTETGAEAIDKADVLGGRVNIEVPVFWRRSSTGSARRSNASRAKLAC